MKSLLLSLSFLAPALLGAADRPYTVAEKGPNHRKLVWTTPVLSPDGVAGQEEHSVIELGSGMHYLDPETGQYRESRELIEIVPGGAVARFGPHRVAWAANLNTRGALDLELPDGRHLVSHVLGLALTDYGPQRRSVLIASLKDTVGVITSPNCLVYDDCFSDLKASIRYTYCKGSLEQDCLILEQLPVSPADFNLDPRTTRLELFSEFLTPPEPRQAVRSLRAATPHAPALEDTDLDWGSMRIGAGRGFLAPAPGRSGSVPSLKSWSWRENRCFLLESFEYEAVQRHLARLPQAANAAGTARRLKDMAALRAVREPSRAGDVARFFPPAPGVGSKQRAEVMLAQKEREEPAYVLDYIIVNSSIENYTFAPDSTYLINAPVYLTGSDNVIAGGSVLKFAPNVNAGLLVQGDLHTATSPSKIAVLTARDDETVGESVPNSTGTPAGFYAYIALEYSGAGGSVSWHDLRIAYAYQAICLRGSNHHELRHAQLLNCHAGVSLGAGEIALRNVLAWNLTNAIDADGAGPNLRAENVTFHQVGNLTAGGDTTSVTLVNCLLSTTGVNPPYTRVNTVTDAGNAFVTVGGGSHYLADSTNCSFGTTDTAHLDPTLLAELKLRTTHPPLLLTNLTQNVVLQPVVPLDTNGQAIGYHYPVLDFLAAGVSVSTDVTVLASNGVTIGLQDTLYAPAFTLNGARFLSEGSPVRQNRLLGASVVQEGAADTYMWFSGGSDTNLLSELRLRHTATAQLHHSGSFHGNTKYFTALEVSHCQVFNKYGSTDVHSTNLCCGFTNTLWEAGRWMYGGSTSDKGRVQVRNNLFRNLYWWAPGAPSNYWTIHDNFFEGCQLVCTGMSATNANNSHNAYFHSTNVVPGSLTNFILTNWNWVWVSGPLGDFYQATNSPLLNQGSQTADLSLLAAFTTTTDNLPETNSTLDVGLHYAALPRVLAPASQIIPRNRQTLLTNLVIVTADGGNVPLQLGLSVSHGALSFLTTNGLTFRNSVNGSGSLVVQATATDLNAALTNLAYLSVTNYHGPDWLNLQANAVGTAPGALPAGTSNGLALQVTNYAPVAQADNYACSYNRVFRAATTEGVLANDSDVNGDLLTASLVSSTLHGSIFLSTNGGFTFLPDVNFSGQDCFTYRVFDGVQYTTNTAVIGLSPANDQPTLSPVQVLLMETDSSTNLSFAAFDPDGNTIYWIARATNFTVQDGLQTRQVTVAIAETGDVYANGYPCLVWDCAMRCQVYERYTDSHGITVQVLGQSATITVRHRLLGDQPQAIDFASPTNGSSFSEHLDIPLAIQVDYAPCSDSPVALHQVEYFCGTNSILSTTNPPFNAIWTNGPILSSDGSDPTADLELTAVASGYAGPCLTSSVVTITIQRDRDWDGVSDAAELQAGTDPHDYYNGVLPNFSIVAGNYQAGIPGTTLANPLQVSVTGQSGQPLRWAPVVFQAPPAQGNFWDPLASCWTNWVRFRTDTAGIVAAPFQLPSQPHLFLSCTASVTAGTGTNAQTLRVAFNLASGDTNTANPSVFLLLNTPLE